uniref:Sema domain-containing protein n=1 Tax=Eptatretus burgeri TaxID=7764 RepID=A0A8C4R1Q8_EPTBU
MLICLARRLSPSLMRSFPGDPGNYKHHFLLAFLMNDKGYFLFTRQEAPGAGERYRTYVARLCMLENPFLSHLEVPLACKQGTETFSVARAGLFGPLGAELAAQLPGRQPKASGESALYIEFGSSLTSETSALCVFTLSQIDNTVEEIRKACYHGDVNKARTEYVHSVHCKLQSRPNSDLDCGADHLPHPIAGLQPILATSVLTHIFPRRITAIAVLTEDNLTIAFLGDRNGHITKVYVQGNEISDDGVMVYGLSSAVSRHMIFDLSWEHFYAMSETQVGKHQVIVPRQ